MIKFELLDNNKYKFNDEIITGNKLGNMVSDGTIAKILKLAADYEKSFSIKSKIDLSEALADEPISTMQTIYFGAPGTGKSYTISKTIKHFYPTYNEKENTNKNVFRTTIHSEYSYYDFVGNILPVSKNNIIDYKFVPGIFTNALFRAFTTNKPVFLVLEEMSRGNIAAIFGDLFQLLDRDNTGNSDYSINHYIICDYILNELSIQKSTIDSSIMTTLENKTIYLPRNLHILGSVNTSDQNVFVMDTAFKRRFQMKYISLDAAIDKNGNKLNNENISIGNLSSKWCDFYPILNKYIIEYMGHSEDKQIGQFFLKFKNEFLYDFSNCDYDQKNRIKEHIKKWNNEQITDKLLLYLWQDIEKTNFMGKKIFNSNIKSFSVLVENSHISTKEIFSNEFLSFFND